MNVGTEVALPKDVVQHEWEHDTEECRSKNTALFGAVCNAEYFGEVAVVEHTAYHAYIKGPDDRHEFFKASNLVQQLS